jgi:hypothetical protein
MIDRMTEDSEIRLHGLRQNEANKDLSRVLTVVLDLTI